jgi:hypothetical protein
MSDHSLWKDEKDMFVDAWKGGNVDGDMARLMLGGGRALSKVFLGEEGGEVANSMLPDGEEAKKGVDDYETEHHMNSKGNLGNKIGSVAGGALGLVGGPHMAAMMSGAGSRIGGFISDLF